jgi:hypothetical protein
MHEVTLAGYHLVAQMFTGQLTDSHLICKSHLCFCFAKSSATFSAIKYLILLDSEVLLTQSTFHTSIPSLRMV